MEEARKAKRPIYTKVPMPEADPKERGCGFSEVNLGYDEKMAIAEGLRCLFCKKPVCVDGCPVSIDIPGFIKKFVEGDLAASYAILKDSNPLPSVCGRVCPQETQCEERCILAKKGDPVAIGYLERYVGDWGLKKGEEKGEVAPPTGKRAAIVGSGPASIACAQDLARGGVDVTIFEALHEGGGVLTYGIPPFRLPRNILRPEVEELKKLGVKFEFNKIIGKIFTIEELMKGQGFDAVFIGTGAGLPKFMGIAGENLSGVLSSNEFLTRANLMHGYESADTPMGLGNNVAVIGAGNTALDSARVSLRMGARNVTIVYRRTKKESPARVEELRHAEEEGIKFHWLTAPVRFFGDKDGRVSEMECIRMELGEPDESGRRSPVPIKGSEFRIPVDTVIYALGTSANPIISRTTPGLKLDRRGYIEVDEETQMTSSPGVFAGGDIVTGGATVILALGAGRKAAKGVLKYLKLATEGREGRKMEGKITVTDSRTNEQYEFPIKDGTIKAVELRKIKVTGDDAGLMTYDPAYMNTASCRSAVTFIDGDKGILRYRGYPIEQLAEASSYLEVAWLLLNGELPKMGELESWGKEVSSCRKVPENIKGLIGSFPRNAHPMGMLISAVAALSTFYPDAKNIDDEASRRVQKGRLIGCMTTLAAYCYRHNAGLPFVDSDTTSSYAANFLRMVFGRKEGVNPALERAMDILFVLHADHEQNASTSVMRSIGSSRIDPITAISGAIGTLYGPLHGGANEAVLRMLEKIGSIDKIPAFIKGVVDGKERLMGFGHRIYKNYDPRARIIKKLAYDVFDVTGTSPLLDVAIELERIALSDDYFIKRKLYPNVDFYSGLIYQAMGFPFEMFTLLFAIGRTSGWLAQWEEMVTDEEQKIARPHQIYTGYEKRSYVPMEKR